MNRKLSGIDPVMLKQLEKYNWRGNIRELKNLIERAVIVSEGDVLTADTLPVELYGEHNTAVTVFDMATVEKNHIRKMLIYTKGNKTEAAKLMNIGITTLYRKIEEYHLG
jgi:transcriptional regulator with PAS, ATPase and Fis domain